MRSFAPSELHLSQVHGLLLGAIGPRPIAFASTMDSLGRPNLAPFSFFNVFSSRPPILIFSPARRGRDNTTKHTFENLKQCPEVVVNCVTYSMVQQMNLASCEYPDGVNEFVKAGFGMLPSETVKPFRVKESPAHFECKVNEIVELGSRGGAGNLIICEVTKIHILGELLNDELIIDQTKIDTVGRMGGDYYTRAHGNALFEVEKPAKKTGVGFDQIPIDVLNSTVLSGNDLGILGNVEILPDETEVNEFRLTELSDTFMNYESRPGDLEKQLHLKAKELISTGKTTEAWKTLLSFNN